MFVVYCRRIKVEPFKYHHDLMMFICLKHGAVSKTKYAGCDIVICDSSLYRLESWRQVRLWRALTSLLELVAHIQLRTSQLEATLVSRFSGCPTDFLRGVFLPQHVRWLTTTNVHAHVAQLLLHCRWHIAAAADVDTLVLLLTSTLPLTHSISIACLYNFACHFNRSPANRGLG